ncbi:MAG: Holliday junction branch migration protein RuvA [Corynebacteriales bacterium]|nr:Holliday junction branch migration protein RuvA [Mycobacteriales bacterium]
MISHIRGELVSVGLSHVVIEVGGVGLSIQCGPNTIAGLHLGAKTHLSTSLVVREDSLTLYGFASEDERTLFELLQTASGVGPRLAQAILAVHSPNMVRAAIANGDTKALTQVSGIGKKGAERLILELKDRIGPISDTESPQSGPSNTHTRDQVVGGIVALGWSTHQAEKATDRAMEELDENVTVPAALKYAIGLLGRIR